MNLKLRELRESHNLTVGQMVERLGIQDSRYRKWESQSAAIPLEYACACCDILHCSLDELAGRESPSLTSNEYRILDVYRLADRRGQRAIERTVDGVAEDMELDALEKRAI